MPIGPPALRKRMGVKQSSFIRSASHKAFIRRQQCVCAAFAHPRLKCEGPIECAHFRSATGGGLGLKPCDRFTFAACNGHHRLQHQVGEAEFQRVFGLDLRIICRDYARRSPDQRIREASQ
jgi:hypothetical protein